VLPASVLGARHVQFQQFAAASLSASDAADLQPHLKPVHLEHEKVLFEAGEKVAAIYSPQAQLSRL